MVSPVAVDTGWSRAVGPPARVAVEDVVERTLLPQPRLYSAGVVLLGPLGFSDMPLVPRGYSDKLLLPLVYSGKG